MPSSPSLQSAPCPSFPADASSENDGLPLKIEDPLLQHEHSSSSSVPCETEEDHGTLNPAQNKRAKLFSVHSPLPFPGQSSSALLPLRKLEKLSLKKLKTEVGDILSRSDPEWSATNSDSPISLLDSLNWCFWDIWSELNAESRQELVSLLPKCDRSNDGTDVYGSLQTSPEFCHQLAIYPDYQRAGLLLPVLSDSFSGTPTPEQADPVIKTIDQLHLMRICTGDMDPNDASLSASEKSIYTTVFAVTDNDEWKDENFEQYWGDLSEQSYKAGLKNPLAGDTAGITIQMLFKQDFLRIGEKVLYRKRFTKPVACAIRLEMEITKFDAKKSVVSTKVIKQSVCGFDPATSTVLDELSYVGDHVGEIISWKTPTNLEKLVFDWIQPNVKRPNGNAWRDVQRVREVNDNEIPVTCSIFQLRHIYAANYEI